MLHVIPFIQSVIGFLLVITLLVFCHELGHFYAARKAGVKVEVFSIGYGKALLKWIDSKGTEWRIGWILAGGYVMMYGDADASSTPNEEAMLAMTDEEKKLSLHFQPLWKRVAVVAAGPFANYALAILIFTIFNFTSGVYLSSNEVTSVVRGMPGDVAGIIAGDRVIAVNGRHVTNLDEIKTEVNLNGKKPIELMIERGDVLLKINTTPQTVEVEDKNYGRINITTIGLSFTKREHITLNLPAAAGHAIKQAYDLSVTVLRALGQIITGQRDLKELSGPLKIAHYSGKSLAQGVDTLAYFAAIISLNLGLINLLPVPILDGGRLFMYAIEAVCGRPISHRIERMTLWVGVILLALLMIVSTFNDVKSLLF